MKKTNKRDANKIDRAMFIRQLIYEYNTLLISNRNLCDTLAWIMSVSNRRVINKRKVTASEKLRIIKQSCRDGLNNKMEQF